MVRVGVGVDVMMIGGGAGIQLNCRGGVGWLAGGRAQALGVVLLHHLHGDLHHDEGTGNALYHGVTVHCDTLKAKHLGHLESA